MMENSRRKQDIVSYEEQIEQGLIRPRRPFVQAIKGEVLPPVKHIRNAPVVVDPYAQHAPQAVQQIVKSESDPITRARAIVMKTHLVTACMAMLTLAVMMVMSWYPHNAGGLLIFLIWIGVASLEWLAAFVMLAILDYKETPAAQAWYQMKSYVRFMHAEQEHRLRAMYPEQYDQNGWRKW
jgi:hypothetical protein